MSNLTKKVRETSEFEDKVEIIVVIIICLLLILAAKYGIQKYEDNYYNVVSLNGTVYSSLDHDIEIYDGKSVVIDGKEYGWSYVNYIKLRVKKGE